MRPWGVGTFQPGRRLELFEGRTGPRQQRLCLVRSASAEEPFRVLQLGDGPVEDEALRGEHVRSRPVVLLGLAIAQAGVEAGTLRLERRRRLPSR
jgi:hypothetical protein